MKLNTWVLPVTGVIAATVVGYIGFPYIGVSDPGERLNAALVLGSLIALLWYTVETNLMQRAVRLQAEVARLGIQTSIMPVLVVTAEDHGDQIKVANVGNGSALNIRIPTLVLHEEAGIWLQFPDVLSLAPGDSIVLTVTTYNGGKPGGIPLGAHLDSEYGQERRTMVVEYEDALRQTHKQEVELGAGSPRIGKSVQ